MKKIYLIICVISLPFIVISQQKQVKNSEVGINTSKFHWYTSSENNSKATPFWTNDFSDASLWTMTDLLHGGTQNWVIGTNPPVGSFSSGMGAISSTTASNGFALYDSDAMATSASNQQDALLIFNNSIDCSNYQYINLNVESYHRKFQDSVFLEVSNDNVNWDRYEMHQDLGVNDGSDNPEMVSINISSTAGNQSSVWFRFRYEGQWDYAWMLDDVSLTETPDNAASISDAVHGGWWVNYSNISGGSLAGFDYTYNTNSQISINPYSFEAVLHNDGVAPQNMTLHAEVFDGNGASVFSTVSPTVLLDMNSQTDTFVCNQTFVPTSNGYYEIKLWGMGDSVNTDTAVLATVVSDDVYGRDWNQPAGSWRVARDCGGMILGTTLDIYADETVYALQIHIDDESVVGTPLYVVLYENSLTDPNADPIYLTQSDDYILTQNDLDSWITVPFDGGQDLYAGTSYLAAVGGYASPVDTFKVNVSGESQGATCWIQDNGCDIGSAGFGAWYWISDIPMIRMSFDPSALSNLNISSGRFNLYPNPNNGVFTVELNDIKVDNYKMSVKNVVGQNVYLSFNELTPLSVEHIDLSNLESGVYILEISNSETKFSEKIVIE